MRSVVLALLALGCAPTPTALDAEPSDADALDGGAQENDADAGASAIDAARPSDAFVVVTDDAGAEPIVEVAMGARQVCALHDSGAVSCWGGNDQGELGTGTASTGTLRPTRVVGLADAVEIGAGAGFSCARRAGGTVACWGDCTSAGWSPTDPSCAGHPGLAADVPSLTDIRTLSVGYDHACALDGAGDAYCWGSDGWAQLGRGAMGDRPTPARVLVAGPFSAIAAGERFTCGVLRLDATVRCWGSRSWGVLGDGVASDTVAPAAVTVSGVSGAVSLSLGSTYACATLTGGAVWCWGEVPGGAEPVPALPTPYPGLGAGARLFRTSGLQFACFVTGDGGVTCAGQNHAGQLGVGTLDGDYHTLAAVPGLTGVTAASSFLWTACAVANGSVFCWASNAYRQCSDSSAVVCMSPMLVRVP